MGRMTARPFLLKTIGRLAVFYYMTKHKIVVPTTLDEIPLAVFQQYQQLDEKMSDVDRAMNAISIICNVSLMDIAQMPLTAMNRIVDLLKETLNEQPKFQQKFTLNGVEYGFIPNLDDLTTGEFIDIESYQKAPNDLWKVMSVLYRPIIQQGQNGRYLIEPYAGTIRDEFKMMPTGVAMGAMVFFYTIGTALLNYMVKYLETNPIPPNLRNMLSTKNGVGLDSSISFVTATSQKWMALSACPFTKLCCGHVTKSTWLNWKNELLIKNLNNDEQ
jgi:hypothetical protein